MEDQIENNSGIDFPGVQLDMYINQSFKDFQNTNNNFHSMELLYVEVASKQSQEKKPEFLFRYDLCEANFGRCSNCYHDALIRVKCPCGAPDGEYCSTKCRNEDEECHSRDCDYLNQLNIKKVSVSIEPVESNAARGLMGLTNLGNTCYMSSALQCLSNLEVLRTYFLQETFKDELNFDNAMGSKGEIVTRFAELLH